jgi:cell division protein ZapA
MGQVSVTLNDRVYRLVCDDGEEDRLVELATYVKAKVAHLTAELGHAGDERLMLMAALMIADELWDARADAYALTAAFEAAAPVEAPQSTDPEPVKRLKGVAARMGATSDAAEPEYQAPADAGRIDRVHKARRRDVA